MKLKYKILVGILLLIAPFIQLSLPYNQLPKIVQGSLVAVGILLLPNRRSRILYSIYGGLIFDGTIGNGQGIYLFLFLIFFIWTERMEQWLVTTTPLGNFFIGAVGYGVSMIVMGFALLFFNGQAALMDGMTLLGEIIATGLYSYVGRSVLPKKMYHEVELMFREEETGEPLV